MRVVIVLVLFSFSSFGQGVDLLRRVDRVLSSAKNVHMELEAVKKARLDLESDLKISNSKIDIQAKTIDKMEDQQRDLYADLNSQIDSTNHWKRLEFSSRYSSTQNEQLLELERERSNKKDWIITGLTALVGVLTGILIPL